MRNIPGAGASLPHSSGAIDGYGDCVAVKASAMNALTTHSSKQVRTS
jgi:hypothetical protein